jgi:hypothetical protein
MNALIHAMAIIDIVILSEPSVSWTASRRTPRSTQRAQRNNVGPDGIRPNLK